MRRGMRARLPDALGSLRWRMVFLLLVTLVPMLATIFYTVARERRHEIAEVQEEVSEQTWLLPLGEERQIESTRQLLAAISQVPAVRATQPDSCRSAPKRNTSLPPKMILLDSKLPKVDGFEALCAIKGDPRTKAIPAAILTSSKEEKDMIQSYQLGVNSYTQKPTDFGQFRHTVKQVDLDWPVVNQPPPTGNFASE